MKLFVIPSDVYHQVQRYGLDLYRFTDSDYIDSVLSARDKERLIWFCRWAYRIIDMGKTPLSNRLSMLEKIYPGGNPNVSNEVALDNDEPEHLTGKSFSNFKPDSGFSEKESHFLRKEPEITDVMLLGENTLFLVFKCDEDNMSFVKNNESHVYRTILTHFMSANGIKEGLNSQLVPLFIRKIS